jgi:ketol-acid reductoisomerase
VISDTAEYGCYLFAHAAMPMLKEFMAGIEMDVIGKGLELKDNGVDNRLLVQVNGAIRGLFVEEVGAELRAAMKAMKSLNG